MKLQANDWPYFKFNLSFFSILKNTYVSYYYIVQYGNIVMFLLEFPLGQNILETIILIPTSRPTTISYVLVLLFVLVYS